MTRDRDAPMQEPRAWYPDGAGVLRARPPLWDLRARKLHKAMAAAGIVGPGPSKAPSASPRAQWRDVVALAEQGKTLADICAELGIGRSNVMRALSADRANRPDLAEILRASDR